MIRDPRIILRFLGKAKTRSFEALADFDGGIRFLGDVRGQSDRAWLHLPLNCGARFSKNADVPSFLSSVADAIPNRTASMYNPSASVVSIPLLTASIVYCTASSPLAIIFCAM